MKPLKVEIYYERENKILKYIVDAKMEGDYLIYGSINRKVPEFDFEIFDHDGKKLLALFNPMFRSIALQEYSNELFKQTELYKQLQELKEIAEK
jgi:hypothetical protein